MKSMIAGDVRRISSCFWIRAYAAQTIAASTTRLEPRAYSRALVSACDDWSRKNTSKPDTMMARPSLAPGITFAKDHDAAQGHQQGRELDQQLGVAGRGVLDAEQIEDVVADQQHAGQQQKMPA